MSRERGCEGDAEREGQQKQISPDHQSAFDWITLREEGGRETAPRASLANELHAATTASPGSRDLDND